MDEMLLGNSAYLKEDYVKRKFMDTWEELCQVLRIPSTIEVEHEDTEESCSTSYPEINRRVQRLLKTDEFPDYVDICDLVERCNTKHKLGISITEKLQISEKLFKAVGKVIKSRRSRDYRAHFGSHLTDLVKMDDDPAIGNSSLLEQLQKSADEGQRLMQTLVDSFVVKQEVEQEKKGEASPQGDSCNEEEEGEEGEEEEGEEEEGEEECRVESEKGSSDEEEGMAAKRIKLDAENGVSSSPGQGSPGPGDLGESAKSPATSGLQDKSPAMSRVQNGEGSESSSIDVGTEQATSTTAATEILITDSEGDDDNEVVVITDSD